MPLNIHIKLEIERDIKREKISNVASYNICESIQDPFIVFLFPISTCFHPKFFSRFYSTSRVASADMAIKHVGCEKFVEIY